MATAVVDEFSPTALEEHGDSVTIYFADSRQRDLARAALVASEPSARVSSRDVDDEDWARRSQENLKPVTIGRLIVTPPWFLDSLPTLDARLPLVITPSMGFGTGHHATTRLCLEALQSINLSDLFVLDVGTGSGILAIAARMLGAREVVGIDYDADAIQAAQENLEANPGINGVRLIVGDLRALDLPGADVITANLTGTLLAQTAETLLSAVRRHGLLIVSGLLQHERVMVLDAFGTRIQLVQEDEAEGWMGITLRKT